jgi:hypothetical protein
MVTAMRYSDHEQRQMDIASGQELDRAAERRAARTLLVDQLRDVRCNREPFTPAHADCICRLTNAAADAIEKLEAQVASLKRQE